MLRTLNVLHQTSPTWNHANSNNPEIVVRDVSFKILTHCVRKVYTLDNSGVTARVPVHS